MKNKDYIINIEILKGNNVSKILEKIESQSLELKRIATVKSGLKAYEIGAGKPPQTLEMKEKRSFHSRESLDETYFKYIDGKNVCRYNLTWNGEFITYGKHLSRPRTFGLFSGDRLLVRQIPSSAPYCIAIPIPMRYKLKSETFVQNDF